LLQGIICESIPCIWSTIPTNSLKINVQVAINIQLVENLECMLGGWKTPILEDVWEKMYPNNKENMGVFPSISL